MCGIFALINNTFENPIIKDAFNKGRLRGPEYSNLCFDYQFLYVLKTYYLKTYLTLINPPQ